MIEKELAKKAVKKHTDTSIKKKMRDMEYEREKVGNIKPKTVGRNTDKTEECVAKLEEILRLDGTVKESCSYANIARSTYYRWIEEDEIFKDRMEDAQEYAFIQARRTINKCIKEGDGKLGLDIMRRRDERYKDKSHSEMSGTVSLVDLHSQNEKKEENGDGLK